MVTLLGKILIAEDMSYLRVGAHTGLLHFTCSAGVEILEY